MDGISIGGSTAVMSSILRAADAAPEVAARLLKTTMQADKDMVATLLPPGGSRLDIRA